MQRSRVESKQESLWRPIHASVPRVQSPVPIESCVLQVHATSCIERSSRSQAHRAPVIPGYDTFRIYKDCKETVRREIEGQIERETEREREKKTREEDEQERDEKKE